MTVYCVYQFKNEIITKLTKFSNSLVVMILIINERKTLFQTKNTARNKPVAK